MAETTNPTAAAPATQAPVLKSAPPATAKAAEGGAYEVLRSRLTEQCTSVRQKVEKLNARRREIFGGLETTLVSSSRINTENSCVPRDIRHIGKKLIIGYDVFLGLKKETAVSDVLAVYEFDGQEFKSLGTDFLDDPKFVKDFKEIFQYYKSAKISQIHNTGTHLLFAFRIGEKPSDIKVLRWALQPDLSAKYIDNRGERDHTFPPQHDFEWTRTSRDQHIFGKHPHVSIKDQIFVECVGGDLTVKIENNTESGKGIFSEPVQDADQSLDDAEIYYVVLENIILLKIRPFGEQDFRYIGYSRLMQRARRIDAIGLACLRLPEGQGVIFPGGYFLQTGECKEFAENTAGMEFFQVIRSLNGEDILYLFYHRAEGRYILLQYNMVKKEAAPPLVCHGYSLYPDGRLVVFRSTTNEAARTHPVQIWQTPFVGENFTQTHNTDSYLGKIGNRELVKGISESLTLAKLATDCPPSSAAYEDLVKHSEALLDHHHWLGHEECSNLADDVKKVRDTANSIIEEFEKVLRIQKNTSDQINAFAQQMEELFTRLRPETLKTIDEHVGALAEFRRKRGHLISLRDLRYADLPRLQAIEDRLVKASDEISHKTVTYLLGADALAPYTAKLDGILTHITALQKVTEAEPVQKELEELGGGLDLLAEIINNLKIDDATARTAIVEALSGVYALLNRTKAQLQARRKDLLGQESIAEFGAQFKLLSQALANYLGLCDTPEKCDDFLSKLLIQVEELESRFSDFPEFIERIAEKRDEIYNAFSSRKQALLDERQRKAGALHAAADRILKGVVRRTLTFTTNDELNGYYAGDPMVLKVNDIVEKLRELGDSVKADELVSRLKSSRDEAVRTLRDKLEIFEDGANIVKFGKCRFSVNAEPLDVSMVVRDGEMYYHITGTDYFELVTDEKFRRTRDLWQQDAPSENENVYRAEYLAWKLLRDGETNARGVTMQKLEAATVAAVDGAAPPVELLELIRHYSADLYDEGYSRGVHDHDAALILIALLRLRAQCGLLRYSPSSRLRAGIFWSHFTDEKEKALILRKAQSLGRMQQLFQSNTACEQFVQHIAEEMQKFNPSRECQRAVGAPPAGSLVHTRGSETEAAEYLFAELRQEKFAGFSVSKAGADLCKDFLDYLSEQRALTAFEADLKALEGDVAHASEIARQWLERFFETRPPGDAFLLDEVLLMLLTRSKSEHAVVSSSSTATVSGLLGQHKNIQQQALTLRLDEFLARVSSFATTVVPRYREYQALRKELLDAERARLRLEEFKPKTMSSFVRNKLINNVFLPIIGENLAKQIGEAGTRKRTDLMGLLLLISPPGYGKTTLMEYVASRLGMTFMKINGPALGTGVLSLDPDEAPNATAREEVQKLNLAFEMGNNVLIYLDDIQHTNPEFLQKFISLCDAQRKIEGVYKGRPRTYDFRGKKVAVAMAGNPYTESGARFQIPDMLANRADTYNLGDIIGGRLDLFELSYIENCITSNPILSPIAARGMDDFYKLVEMSEGAQTAETDLGHDYSSVELKDMMEVIRKLRVVQKTVLRVNQEYIASASQKDEFRTEPPFKLQGSYRNMNKIAAKVQPVLTEQELQGIVNDHYSGEAQALSSAAEHNLLKLAEILQRQTPAQKERWDEIKRSFNRSQSLLGADKDDKVAHVVTQLISFNENLDRIRGVLAQAATNGKDDDNQKGLEEALSKLSIALQQNFGAQQGRVEEKLEALAGKIVSSQNDNGKDEAPKIEIINTLPEYYTNLYKHHMNTIESVLVPLVKGLSHQIKSTEVLHAMLGGVSERLQALVGELSQQKRRHKKAPAGNLIAESTADGDQSASS